MSFKMPEEGTAWETLSQEMLARGGGDVKWRDGKTAVYVFNAGPDVTRVHTPCTCQKTGLGRLPFPA